ncbi:MAG: PD40 domain-containing protein [Armatimonadetes bacterium]|nr:PD40 domain-containing protein [Anaerolineae bacterium]
MRNYKGLLIAFCIFGVGALSVAQTTPELPDFPGSIAYVDLDHNIGTVGIQDNALDFSALTTDGSDTRRYQFPTWSTDGRLAYFCCDAQFARRITAEVFITQAATVPGVQVYDEPNDIFTYAYWSPADCDTGERCRDLGILIGQSNGQGFGLDRIRDTAGEVDVQTLGTGAPFYYSWSGDGTQLLWHRDNNRLEIYNVEKGEITAALEQLPGLFPAPMWSPTDDRLLINVANLETFTTELVILDGDDITTLQAGIQGQIAFSWSPDGEQVAFRILDQNGYGRVVVVDARSGAEIAVSRADGVVAFFWSPDSRTLAFVTVENAPSTQNASTSAQEEPPTILLSWQMLTVSDNQTQRLVNFAPTAETLYMLGFFDQFAQSHQFWSPDSRFIVYADLAAEETPPGVYILDVRSTDTEPYRITDGVLGIWSYQ